MENAKETPLQDLMKDALDHYNEAGNAISHHRNDVYLAIEQYYKLKMEKEKGIDKNWIMEILDKTNAFAKQLIEDHFNRHKIEVYSRPECPFKYCDDPETCKKLGKCHNT